MPESEREIKAHRQLFAPIPTEAAECADCGGRLRIQIARGVIKCFNCEVSEDE